MSREADVFEFKDGTTSWTVFSPHTEEVVLDNLELAGEAFVGLDQATDTAADHVPDTFGGFNCWIAIHRPGIDDGGVGL